MGKGPKGGGREGEGKTGGKGNGERGAVCYRNTMILSYYVLIVTPLHLHVLRDGNVLPNKQNFPWKTCCSVPPAASNTEPPRPLHIASDRAREAHHTPRGTDTAPRTRVEGAGTREQDDREAKHTGTPHAPPHPPSCRTARRPTRQATHLPAGHTSMPWLTHA